MIHTHDGRVKKEEMSIVFIAFSLRPKKGTQIMELTREKSLFITIFVPKNVLTIKALEVIKTLSYINYYTAEQLYISG